MKRFLFSALVLIGLLALSGCDTSKSAATAPRMSAAIAQTDHAGEFNVTWTRIDATHMEKSYYVGRMVHGQTVTIGPIKVIYYLDYPTGFMGPIPPGHCRTDGSGCN